MQKYLPKIDRFFAWVLFGTMLLYFITGLGMTKGIIDPTFAAKLHLSILTYVIMIAFTFHTFYAIHLAFKRWRIWNLATKSLLFLFFAAFFGFFVYVDKFYQPNNSSDNQSSSAGRSQNSQSSNSSQSTSSADTQATKTFTVSELAKYNGRNGQPAYVAVDGNVYDLSNVFRSGSHHSHFAGSDLTNSFYSYHAKQILSKYPIVGQLSS